MKKTPSRAQIILFLVVSVLYTISISAFDPFISVYTHELGFRPAIIGIIVGAAGFSSMLARFPVGIAGDFIKNKLFVIRLGLAITVVGWSLAFLYPTPATLIIGKVADGLTGAVWVVFTTLFTGYFAKEDTAKAIGLISFSATFGNFTGSLSGGLAAHHLGYRYSFLVAVIAAVAALVLTLYMVKTKDEVQSTADFNTGIIKEQLTDRTIWIIGLASIVALIVPYATRDLFTPIIAGDLGGTALSITLLANIHMIAGGLAQLMLGSVFQPLLGLKKTIIASAVGQGVIAALIPHCPNLVTLYGLQALAGFLFNLNFTALMALAVANVDPAKQSTRMGLYQSIYSFGMFFGPTMAGRLAEMTSMEMVFVIVGAVSVLMALFLCFQLKSDSLPREKGAVSD